MKTIDYAISLRLGVVGAGRPGQLRQPEPKEHGQYGHSDDGYSIRRLRRGPGQELHADRR